MRDPAWNKERRACSLAMNPADVEALGLQDGQMVKIITDTGEAAVELEVTATTRPGLVIIPHGFGLEYQGQQYGINVNSLTKNTHRDPLAGTPYHRYVPCRVEAVWMQMDYPQLRKKRVCSVAVEEFVRRVEDFHGAPAPGVVLGGYMVELAYLHLPPEGSLFDARPETFSCLPDAIQLLTPCSIGNGWLKVLDLGKFALSLYDKNNGNGVRVFVDPAKLAPFLEIKTWFFKLKPKREQDLDVLLEEIHAAASQICGTISVKLKPEFRTPCHRAGFRICPVCRESYPAADRDRCRACGGEAPYL